MDNAKEGGYVNHPPNLDGTNFDYWKARMVTFLKFMENNVEGGKKHKKREFELDL